MLFDTLKRKNKAEQEERAWSQQAPAAYESRNKETMDALTGQVGSGYDGSTLAKAYQQYREQAADAAAKSAENAQATAAALAGGYGSSYADSVARQNQAAALEGIASAVPGLRSKALTEYQNEQNGLLAALSGMGTTEALDRSAYGSNLANYNNQLNFLRSQSAQARNENDNFWNNVWNGIKTAGNVARSAYDGYMGYTQQQWENEMAQAQFDFQKQQYADSLARQSKADNTRAYEDAFNLYKAGAGDAASDVLNQYGLNADAFANYTGAPITRDDQASALSAAASLVAGGNTEAAANLLKMYGMDADVAGTYTTLMQRQLATAAAKAALTKTGSFGRSSGSSRKAGASGGSNHGYTNAQLLQMSKTYSSMKDSDPQKEYYQQVLTDAGYLEPETASAAGGLIAPLANPNKWALTGGTTGGSTGKSATQSSDTGTLLAQRYAKRGYSAWAIANIMSQNGYSDKEISDALEKAGVE
ncbi:hypothetical protein [Faecalibacterium prausnitzii]|uniref:hypothetical protein n=1 Tax=Faecalibacterium prausnitzii TaxID=853 RepID=UPI0026657651|nr:hypothetical protein [Faecalibacterium prausnitzii]